MNTTLTERAALEARAGRHGYGVRGLTDMSTLREGNGGVVFYPLDPEDRRSCIAFPNATEASIWLTVEWNKVKRV